MKKPVVDYRRLRRSNLTSPEFSHLLLLLYWPLFGILFQFVERGYRVEQYYPMYCPLDDLIPFCEWFVLAYTFWFVFLAGMHLYTLLYEPTLFRKMMYFIMITYTVTIVIYFLFPTCQQLRPTEFQRDNPLTRFVAGYYNFDTNTNVCPSIHVIGSLAVMFTALHCRGFRWPIKAGFVIVALLICLSTVFLKQHSVLDVAAALPLCTVAYFICFGRSKRNDLYSV